MKNAWYLKKILKIPHANERVKIKKQIQLKIINFPWFKKLLKLLSFKKINHIIR